MNLFSNFKTQLATLAITISAAFSPLAQAHSPRHGDLLGLDEVISFGEIQLSPRQTYRLELGSWRHVGNIKVSAYVCNNNTSSFEVWVNGERKANIVPSCVNREYLVSVGETTNRIEFRSTSSYAYSTITKVSGNFGFRDAPIYTDICGSTLGCPDNDSTVIPEISPSLPTISLPSRNQSSALAARAIKVVDALESYASYAEYGHYLLPIKKVAARTYATTAAYGDLSLQSRQALLALQSQIAYANDYLDVTFERDAAFQLAIELKSLGEKLAALLR